MILTFCMSSMVVGTSALASRLTGVCANEFHKIEYSNIKEASLYSFTPLEIFKDYFTQTYTTVVSSLLFQNIYL